MYNTRAITSPFFTAVYNQERLILETIYVVNKEILQKIRGLQLRVVSNQERVIMARIRYIL